MLYLFAIMKPQATRLFFLLFFVVFTSCKNKKDAGAEEPLFQMMPSASTNINFSNNVKDDGDYNVFNYRNFYNGGGVAIGDVNNDGKPDIFFTSNQGDCKLYINKGNWKFEDATAKAGLKGYKRWHTGVTMVDINGDGWLDIYVCNSGGLNDADRAK